MKKLWPQERFSNPNISAAPTDDVNAVLQRIQTAFDKTAQDLHEQRITKDLAKLFQANPLRAETAVRDANHGMCRMLLGKALDTHQRSRAVFGR